MEEHGRYLRLRTACEGDCWNWLSTTDRTTPVMRDPLTHGRTVNVRRFTLELMGRKMARLLATVSCGNLRCVNPDHLVAVTRKTLQRMTAERNPYAQNPARNAKISKAKRARSRHSTEVIAQVVASTAPTRQIAREYGMAQATVQYWKRNASRRELDGRASPWAGLGGRA